MTKSNGHGPVRPPASGKQLEAAIEQSLKALENLATPRLRPNGNWRHGPLVWKVMLDMSLAGIARGTAPSIRKHDLSYELKRSNHGSHIEVDRDLWNRYLSFHRQYGSRMREGMAKVGLPALTLERVTNNGVGGYPDTTEAVFWLCFDSESKPSAATTSQVLDALQNPEVVSADQASGCAVNDSPATSEPAAPQPPEIPENHGSASRAEPTKSANDQTGPAVAGKDTTVELQTDAGRAYLLWLATLSSRTGRSSTPSATLVLALALLAPALGCVAAEIISPVQALTDSISSLADVFNGSLGIRT